MEQEEISPKLIIITGIVFLMAVCGYALFTLNRNYTLVVFCDVGQGDGAYIRTRDHVDIVIDAGPPDKMATCLGKYMPFFDRTIELAFLTHPQLDHYGGYNTIVDRYGVKYFITPPIDSANDSFIELKNKLLAKHIAVKNLYRGQNIKIGKNDSITDFWPTRQLIADRTTRNDKKQSKTLAAYKTTDDPNIFCEVFLFTDGKFHALFTGDITADVFYSMKQDPNFVKSMRTGIDILKVPHHGSKYGLNEEFLKLADPTLSVISVAKKNRYGHPSKEVLALFKALHKKYLATSTSGDVVIHIDDQGWKVVKGN